MEHVQTDFDCGKYQQVITVLKGREALSVREMAILGISIFRAGYNHDAEPVLLRASLLGDLEARVEYANLLRATGRLADALDQFQMNQPQLSGELELRNLRWWGVTQFQRGEMELGLKQCERAWHGYITLGDDFAAAKTAQNLATMHKQAGNHRRAEELLRSVFAPLKKFEDVTPLLTAMHTLVEILLERGKIMQADEVMQEAQQYLVRGSLRSRTYFLGSAATIHLLNGEHERHRAALTEVMANAEELGEHELYLWATVKLAEHHSRMGDHAAAIRTIYQYSSNITEEIPPQLRTVRAVVHRRRGALMQAISELTEIVDSYKAHGRHGLELTRSQLQLAYAYFLSNQLPETAAVLQETLESLLRLHTQSALRPELEELSELLHYAALEPDLAPYLEPVLENLAGIAGMPDPGAANQIRLQLFTFGRVSVAKDNEEVHLSLKGSVPLLVYLALRPGRTRAEMQLDLYPDKEPETAGSYIRSAIRELRELLGREVIVHDGPHHQPRYRLGPGVRLDLDLVRFMDAVEHGEVAKALAIFRGEFLPGMDESDWVLQRREEAQLALTFELRNQIVRFKSEGELRRVILLCNQYLRIDPYERDVHQERVEAARKVGSPAELARYVSQMNSLDN